MPKGVFDRKSTLKQMQDLHISYEEFLQARLRYYSQVKTARKRGIIWGFTFKSWVTWWRGQLGPDWITKRGKYKNQFVMARKGDKGHYHPDNVKCVKASENASERKENGTAASGAQMAQRGSKNTKAKLCEVDIPKIRQRIKNGERVVVIAKAYNVSLFTIYRANKNGWGHVK